MSGMYLVRRGRILFWSWAAIGLLIFAGWLAGCRRSQSTLDVRLSDLVVPTVEATSYPPDRDTLRMAVAAVNSPRITLTYYSRLADYLATRLGMQGELVQGKTYAEINDLVREGNVTLAMVCTNPYVEGQEDFGMEALAVPEVNGEAVYYSYLIVPQDSPASSMADLRGKVFAFTDPMSNTGRLYPTYLVQQLGEEPKTFFRRTFFTYSHDDAIRAVAAGLADGAGVDSLVYEFAVSRDPELAAKTKVIHRSPPFGSPPVVMNPDLSPKLQAELQALLLGLDEQPEGQQILKTLGVERFVVVDDATYESVRQLEQEVGPLP